MHIVQVKFCGSCNPSIDADVLFEEVIKMSGVSGDVQFTCHDSPEAKLLLVLCACTAGCAALPDFKGYTIKVAGETLDAFYCPREKLSSKIVDKLKGYISEVESNG
ncbi:MAG: hypothetical protein AB1420_06030 [Bacillota bacterium]